MILQKIGCCSAWPAELPVLTLKPLPKIIYALAYPVMHVGICILLPLILSVQGFAFGVPY